MDTTKHPIFTSQTSSSLLKQLSRCKSDRDTKPLILILGSGFSYGLVPTVTQFVEQVFPAYFEDQDAFYDAFDKNASDNDPENHLANYLDSIEIAQAAAYWKKAYKETPDELNDESLPQDYGSAYRDVFNIHKPDFGFTEQNQSDQFLARLIHANIKRLNAAHFMLASIMDLHKQGVTKQPFTEQIFTTNFDPFLQKALQLVNQLYLVTDTPELEDALNRIKFTQGFVNLVYVHGTHNRHMANYSQEILEQQKKNAQALGKHFQQSGSSILVLGYGGWDDALVQALCETNLDGNLHWCDLKNQSDFEETLDPDCHERLRKSQIRRRTYTQINSADDFMCKLYAHLSSAKLPRLLQNPETTLIEQLEELDLSEARFPIGDLRKEIILEDKRHSVIQHLKNITNLEPVKEPNISERLALLEESEDWESMLNYAENTILSEDTTKDSVLLLFASGIALNQLKYYEEASEKYAQAIQIRPDFHDAFFNRACIYALMQKPANCLQDLEQWKVHAPSPTANQINDDHDFDLIRNEPEFKEFVASLEQAD